MKILPINNSLNRATKNFSFQSNSKQAVLNKTVKNVLIPTATFLAMMMPSSCAIQKDAKMKDLPYYIQKDAIQKSKEFEMDGKNYTMYYTDYCKNFTERDKAVSEIYFVPEDFRLLKDGEKELNSPMMLEQLVYHDLEDKTQNFVSAVVSEGVCDEDGENYKNIIKEIVLPDKIGKTLLKLYQGKTSLYLLPGVNTYTTTNSEKLMEPIIQNRIMLELK